MNVIARPEYELAHYDSAVYRFNHYTSRTRPRNFHIFVFETKFREIFRYLSRYFVNFKLQTSEIIMSILRLIFFLFCFSNEYGLSAGFDPSESECPKKTKPFFENISSFRKATSQGSLSYQYEYAFINPSVHDTRSILSGF